MTEIRKADGTLVGTMDADPLVYGEVVDTTRGPMKVDELEKKTGEVDDDNEFTRWVEFWFDGELVKRSVHVHLKKNVVAEGVAAMLA